jgi:hypothetical protein
MHRLDNQSEGMIKDIVMYLVSQVVGTSCRPVLLDQKFVYEAAYKRTG